MARMEFHMLYILVFRESRLSMVTVVWLLVMHISEAIQDFIACSEHVHLIDTKVTDNKHLVCSGVSAGGLLIGSIMNMRGDRQLF